MWDYYTQKELTPAVVPGLIERLAATDFETQFDAVMALEAIGPPAIEAAPFLLQLAQKSQSDQLRGRIERALGAIKSQL